MIESVTNHMFLITDKDMIVVGDKLNELLYKKYRGELIVKDVIIDPHLCKKELEIAKIIAELFKGCPRRTYGRVLDKLYREGVFVYTDEFLDIILSNWDNLKFKDLKIKYKSPHNTIKLETHIKNLL